MADYLKALSDGVSAAQQAKKNHLAIEYVLAEASAQLSAAAGQRIRFVKQEAKRAALPAPASKSSRGVEAVWERSWKILQEMVPYTALALCVDDEKDGWVYLCEWIDHQDGFPVRLKFSGKEVTCHDQRSLEAGLMSVLSDSKNGAQVEALLSRAKIELKHPLARLDTGMDEEL